MQLYRVHSDSGLRLPPAARQRANASAASGVIAPPFAPFSNWFASFSALERRSSAAALALAIGVASAGSAALSPAAAPAAGSGAAASLSFAYSAAAAIAPAVASHETGIVTVKGASASASVIGGSILP